MDIGEGAIEEDLASGEVASFNIPKVDFFTLNAVAFIVVVFVVIAAIAWAVVANGQEVEIVIVRFVVEKWIGAAGLYHLIGDGRPQAGSQEEWLPPSLWRINHENLCRIAI